MDKKELSPLKGQYLLGIYGELPLTVFRNSFHTAWANNGRSINQLTMDKMLNESTSYPAGELLPTHMVISPNSLNIHWQVFIV